MIISIKSFIDLFSCLVDVIVNQEIRDDHKMPDIRNIKNNLSSCQPVWLAIQELTNPNLNTWIQKVKNYRDCLIHRGYRLEPSFHFKKCDELTIKLIKGNSEEKDYILVGEIFNDTILGLSQFENDICKILMDTRPELLREPLVEMSYKTSGGASFYNIKQIDEE
ncbi:hypothetical protein [[Flexibacter] sp. ATCC 35208]|uniref:hypothetical protein n=1 Tax=[Flexibacter] sp. ATCC 35208 TaxID=1936242 RepID=UPI0009CF798E|nr:hypothetical protein [[Flexibacter] sp. ATCC 35208]OMP74562.1 hypothetical protein BW716_34695 [[Flexibacter] sp. ATCC 35208]